jgi:hypothetical protein
MVDKSNSATQHALAIPPDDPLRKLATIRSDTDQKTRHIGVVGDTYTILLTGQETAGRFCLIDTYVPPGGGPPPHRHDFEKTWEEKGLRNNGTDASRTEQPSQDGNEMDRKN